MSFAPIRPGLLPPGFGHPSSLWGGHAALQTDPTVDFWWEQARIADLEGQQMALPWRVIGGAVLSGIGGWLGSQAGQEAPAPTPSFPVPTPGTPAPSGETPTASMATGRTVCARYNPATGRWEQVRRRRRRKRALSCQDKADIAFLKGQGMSMDKAASLVMSKC